MSEFKSPNFRNEDGSAAPDIVGVTTFTSPYYFVPPSGTTAERPSGDGLAPGMLRFNTDIGRLEVWRGDHWATILGESPNLGVNGALGARGVFGTGVVPGVNTNIIDYVTISTLGNAQDFGDLTAARRNSTAFSSSTRGCFAGGASAPATPGDRCNIIDYITISSTGNAQDFGDLLALRRSTQGCASSTRGLSAGGNDDVSVAYNVIEYVTIASTGNSADFGDLLGTYSNMSSCSSSVRGIFAGGSVPNTGILNNIIQYVTISTLGDGIDFGDLTIIRDYPSSCSSSTRGLFAGGASPASPTASNSIDFITIATLGNAQDFGDLLTARRTMGGFSSPIRGVFGGGYINPAGQSNIIEYVSINNLGNALDFGDLTGIRGQLAGLSNAHGGL